MSCHRSKGRLGSNVHIVDDPNVPGPSGMNRRGSLSSANSSQSHDSPAAPERRVEDMAVDLVQSVLVCGQTKTIIKKSDLTKLLNTKKITEEVWNIARHRLHRVFGYKLVEIEGGYIVVREKISNRKKLVQRSTDLHDGLLVMCLGFMFMCAQDKFVEIQSILDFFHQVNVDKKQEVFTGMKTVHFDELITGVWVRNLYLKTDAKGQIRTDRIEDIRVRWGPRAHLEFSQMDILELMAKILDTKPEDWVEQHNYIRETIGISSTNDEVDAPGVVEVEEENDENVSQNSGRTLRSMR